MKKTKAQLSMFIVVGIVLLIMVGFFVYVFGYTIKKQAQRGIKTSQKQELRIKVIENFITACLEKTAKKGLRLIGEQGGVIFKEQGGLTEEIPMGNYLVKGNTKIWFGIRNPITATCNAGDGCFADCSLDPDCAGHTCDNGLDGFCVIGCSYIDMDCGSDDASTCGAGDGCHYGCNFDPDCGGASCNAGDGCVTGCNPIDIDCAGYGCSEDGICVLGCNPVDMDCAKNEDRGFNTNAPLYPWKCFPNTIFCTAPTTFIGYFGRDLLPYLEGIDSINSQLKTFIRNNITNCINLTIFEEQGFDIKAGAVGVDIMFAEKDTVINLNYPLNINHYKTKEKATLKKFSYNANVNLRGIHNYSKNIINQDITDIRFNPASSSGSFTASINNFGSDDIITITDSNSIIDGETYSFSFARENRRPALEMLGTQQVDVNDDVDVLFNQIIGGAIPLLHDPDEDIDCSSFAVVECSGDSCLLANCNRGNIKLECPSIRNFKTGKKIGGPVTQNKPYPHNNEPELCNVTISDGILEDYQRGVGVWITPGSP